MPGLRWHARAFDQYIAQKTYIIDLTREHSYCMRLIFAESSGNILPHHMQTNTVNVAMSSALGTFILNTSSIASRYILGTRLHEAR